MAREQASEAVLRAVTEVTQGMEPKRSKASRAVLLGGLKPREAAAEVGLPAEVVGWAVRRARSDLKRRHANALRAYV